MRKTQFLNLMPWDGGLSTAVDEGFSDPNTLRIADNVVFSTGGQREKRQGGSYFDSSSIGAVDVLDIRDYWRTDASNNKQQLLLSYTSGKKLYKYDSGGVRTEITGTGGPSGTVTTVTSACMNELAIFFFNGSTNTPIKYNPDSASTYAALGGSPPAATFGTEWLGRLFCNDQTDPDLLHYCTTGNPEEWGGVGDSGAIPIGTGDGDEGGIIGAIPFKGMLFVFKKSKIYRISGYAPEEWIVEPVSYSIGLVGPKALCAIGDQDIVFVSRRGIHSLSATQNYGDVESKYLSSAIQPTFNTDWSRSRLSYVSACHVESLNSVAFAMTATGDSANNDLYLYNYNVGRWYRWPDLSCQSLSTRDTGTFRKLVLGTSAGRVIQMQNGTYTDFGTTGITYRLKTPTLYPGNDITRLKGFYRLYLYYKPLNTFTITVTVQIDKQDTQSFTFSNNGSGDALGTTFVLGTSLLGISGIIEPFNAPIEGRGRGITVEITQSGTNEQVTIYALQIEYEDAEFNDNTTQSE
jgi:hypothetical protein